MAFLIEKDSAISESVKLNYHRVMSVEFHSKNVIFFKMGGFISQADSDAGKQPISYGQNILSNFSMPWASFNQALPAYPQVYYFIKSQPGWEDAQDDSQQLVLNKG